MTAEGGIPAVSGSTPPEIPHCQNWKVVLGLPLRTADRSHPHPLAHVNSLHWIETTEAYPLHVDLLTGDGLTPCRRIDKVFWYVAVELQAQ